MYENLSVINPPPTEDDRMNYITSATNFMKLDETNYVIWSQAMSLQDISFKGTSEKLEE